MTDFFTGYFIIKVNGQMAGSDAAYVDFDDIIQTPDVLREIFAQQAEALTYRAVEVGDQVEVYSYNEQAGSPGRYMSARPLLTFTVSASDLDYD